MEALGEHCYEKRAPYGVCGGILGLVFIIIFSISWDTVEPTEFGLLRNTISGAVNLGEIYENGRFVVGPAAEFIHFPRNRITLSYGARETDDRTAIPARTGPGEGQGVDSDSGGQPLDLSISFQYLLVKENIPVIYSTYASSWEASYLRFAQQAITNVAQEFNPSAFWRRRAHIEAAMLVAVNQTLFEQGYATAVGLQLRSVGFQTTYEQTITNIQLQEQLKVTKSYQQEVIAVEKQVHLYHHPLPTAPPRMTPSPWLTTHPHSTALPLTPFSHHHPPPPPSSTGGPDVLGDGSYDPPHQCRGDPIASAPASSSPCHTPDPSLCRPLSILLPHGRRPLVRSNHPCSHRCTCVLTLTPSTRGRPQPVLPQASHLDWTGLQLDLT